MRTIRIKIMEEADKLFAEKGFLTTSVQDIIKQCHISKGSFYNYFKSKEELAFHLFKEKKEALWEKIHELEDEEFDERERFAAQLKVHFEHVYQNRELVQIAFQYLDHKKELAQFLTKAQMRDLHWVSRQLIRVYGDPIAKYTLDCATLLVGLTITYALHSFMTHCKEIDLEAFVQYALRRMDGIVSSFSEDEKPLFTQQIIDTFLQDEKRETLYYYQQVKGLIVNLRQKLEKLYLEKRQHEKIAACLDTLEQEFSSTEDMPKEFICEGMLLYLAQQKIPTFEPELEKLSELIHQHR